MRETTTGWTAQPVHDGASRCAGHRHAHVCRACGTQRPCCLPECAGLSAGVCAGACPERLRPLAAPSARFQDARSDAYRRLMRPAQAR